jgi:hypothetical protein
MPTGYQIRIHQYTNFRGTQHSNLTKKNIESYLLTLDSV